MNSSDIDSRPPISAEPAAYNGPTNTNDISSLRTGLLSSFSSRLEDSMSPSVSLRVGVGGGVM